MSDRAVGSYQRLKQRYKVSAGQLCLLVVRLCNLKLVPGMPEQAIAAIDRALSDAADMAKVLPQKPERPLRPLRLKQPLTLPDEPPMTWPEYRRSKFRAVT